MQNPLEIDNETTERPTRNIFLRILFGGIWFVALYLATYIIIACIEGIVTGTSKFKSGAEASAAGGQAGEDFADKYGLILILSYILLFSVLCFFRLLPGVAKYKKSKPRDT